MKLTPAQSELLKEVCQYEIEDSDRISHFLDNLLLRLSGVKPLDTFESRMQLIKYFSTIQELKSSEEYDYVIHLLEDHGNQLKRTANVASFFTRLSIEDLALMDEINPKSNGMFQRSTKADYYLALAERLKISKRQEGYET